MRKWLDRLLMGYLIQIPVLLFLVVIAFIWQFFDTLYNRFFLELIFGRSTPWGGFLMSVLIAIILGVVAETKRGWAVLGGCLNKIPLAGFIATLVEQWKKFRVLAHDHGMVLAPYYRDKSGFWPGVVTGVLPKDGGGYLVSVVFLDFPFPKPLLLTEDDMIYTKLTVGEAFAYILSGGLGFRMLNKKMKEKRLRDFIGPAFFEGNDGRVPPA